MKSMNYKLEARVSIGTAYARSLLNDIQELQRAPTPGLKVSDTRVVTRLQEAFRCCCRLSAVLSELCELTK